MFQVLKCIRKTELVPRESFFPRPPLECAGSDIGAELPLLLLCDHGLVLLGSSDILWRWLSWAMRPVLSDPKEGAGSALVGGASRPTVRRSAARRLGAIDPAAGTRARCLPTLAFRF